MEKVIVVKDEVKNVRRFNIMGRTIEFRLKPIPGGAEPVSWIKDAINHIIEKGTENLNSSDQIGFTFSSMDFSRGEGWLSFRPAAQVYFDDVWDVISKIYQSNASGINTESFCLGITSVSLPTGKGRHGKYNTFEEECRMRRGIICISNKDRLCLPRALVVAIANIDKEPNFNKIRRDIGKIQTTRTKSLLKESKVLIPEQGAGIPELQQFQNHLKNYQILVYKYGSKGRDLIFKGASESPKKLNLLHHQGHFNVIISLTAAFSCSYYCEECHKPYAHKEEHRCGGTCSSCQQSPRCLDDQIKIRCDSCHRYFKGQVCYDNHLKDRSRGKSSVCAEIHCCTSCFKTVKSNRKHICGEIFCKNCNSHVPENHLCYFQKDNVSPKIKDTMFVFYDLETRQEEVREDGSLLHEANLCVFKQCCDKCINTENNICGKCGVRLQELKGSDPVGAFTQHLLTLRKTFQTVVVIAHNGQAFDHQFILNYILTKTDLTPELIMRGTKIIMMQVANVKFIDSLNYFPMRLSKLPQAFGLGDNFKKGYFPHLFNRQENQDYNGPLPPLEFYSPDSMKEDDRNNFLHWYEEHKNDQFEMQRDLAAYCKSDVEILTRACLKFREQLMTTTNVCPFTEATTIASACQKVFRRNFLKPETIGIIPKNGYRWTDQQSKIAIQWLVWEEHQKKINIVHAAKGDEAIICGVKVDGFCRETNQIFEFQGCYWHGCPKCYKMGRNDPIHKDITTTLNLRYEATQNKIEKLRSLGYLIYEMWECDFIRMMQEHPEIDSYTSTHPLLLSIPLLPRDAFFGGRTGNVWEYYEAKDDEKIKYADVCSLYPYVCKYGKFPIGHPEIFVGEEKCQKLDLNNTSGLIKCTILPPEKLYHPVLPQKMNNKLMFVLCRKCGSELNQDICYHTEAERALTGTWVIEEIVKALSKGYKLLNVYEIWKYNTQKFNKETGEEGLFTSMMNTFIKIKQEASGWPSDCQTEEARKKYLVDFFEKEGVELEYERIVENAGLRSLAKLMLNSFWGKFGQRENQPKTKIINDPSDFFSMFLNPTIQVNSDLVVNEETLIVNFEYTKEAFDPLHTVNVVIAAYVTALARLKLYSYLEELEDRVLYYDTDSVIYISRGEELDIPTGQFIGDMTDELESYGINSYITKFVSGGPKNYAFQIHSTKNNKIETVCKVKGISLNYEASKLINFDSIKDMVLKKTEPIPIISNNIRRTKEHQITTCRGTKVYRPNSTKRKFLPDGGSVPYGYKIFKLN